MTLTPEQRAEISRENGKKSERPVTPEGKARSRQNSYKHGCRAEALSLPTEGPEVIQVRADAWNDYYQPQSPAAEHLVTECVRATLLADRVHHAHTAALSKQVRGAVDAWDHDRDALVASQKKLLLTDPAEAIRLLQQTSDGCTYMIVRWDVLDEALVTRGHWTGPECEEATRLMGHDPGPDKLSCCPESWLTRLFNLLCIDVPSQRGLKWLLDDARAPDAYDGVFDHDNLPDQESCRKALRAMIAEQRAPLAEEEARRMERDELDRAEAPERAMVLQDPASARLMLRYQAEARLSFQRAYSQLLKTLAHDKAAAEAAVEAVEAVSPNEPAAPAPAPEAPARPEPAVAEEFASPNEPGAPVSEADVMALAAVLRGETLPVVPDLTAVS